MIKTAVIAVKKATRRGVIMNVNGKEQTVSWDTLRAAAVQDDAALRAVYSDLLAEAKRMAAQEKTLEITIVNRTNTPHGHAAELYDMAGEFVSGRIVAADFGLDDTHDQAKRDCEEASRKLTEQGYTIVRNYR